MHDKFIDESTTLEREEISSRHAFEILVQDLHTQIDQATQDKDEKAETKAKKLQAKAEANGVLQNILTTPDADQKYLDDLTAACEQKALTSPCQHSAHIACKSRRDR